MSHNLRSSLAASTEFEKKMSNAKTFTLHCLWTPFPSFLEKVSRSYLKACLENEIFYLGCQAEKS